MKRRRSIEEQATKWLVRMRSGDATDEDRQRFERWLSLDPDHRQAFRAVSDVWHRLDEVPVEEIEDRQDQDATFLRIARRLHWEYRYRRWLRPATAVAVCLFAILGASFSDLQHYLASDFHTAVGERAEVKLADGSTLHLNTDSAVSIRFDATRRSVHLLRGEALFDVVAGKARPFEVIAGDVRTTVLGTQFVVRSDGAEVHVAVAEGRVAVASKEGDPGPSLDPAEQVRYGAGVGFGEVKRTRKNLIAPWMRGRLVFDNRPLGEVVAEIGRYRRGWVIIPSPELRELRVSGTFGTDDPEQALRSVEEILALETTRLSPLLVVIHGSDRQGIH